MRIKAATAIALLITFAVVGALGLARREPEQAREEPEFAEAPKSLYPRRSLHKWDDDVHTHV